MLCQSCKKNEATVHITRVVNGVKEELHLCEECAKKQNIDIGADMISEAPMSFQNILEGFFQMMGGAEPRIRENNQVCPVCGMSFNDFTRTGKFGCSNCYKVFRDDALPVIKRIHGNIQHTGKVPGRTGEQLKIKRDIESLKVQLKDAIDKEQYENAAVLRDKIKELEEKRKVS